MEVELKITKSNLDRLTWGDWETLQEGNIGYRDARRIIAMFMVDESGKSLPMAEAMEKLRRLTTGEMILVLEKFKSAISKAVTDFVPNEKGSD